MQRRLIALLALVALCGCVSTSFRDERVNPDGVREVTIVSRDSLFYKAEIGRVSLAKDGTLNLTGYKGSGDPESMAAMAAIVEAAVRGAVAGAK